MARETDSQRGGEPRLESDVNKINILAYSIMKIRDDVRGLFPKRNFL